MQTVTLGATGLKVSLGALDLTLSHADLAEIDDIMAAAVPVRGPTPEGMS